MNLVEMEENDILYYRVDSFKKLLQRKRYENIQRVITGFHSMELLLRNNFDYQAVYKKTKDEIQLLADAQGEYNWSPMGFEVVRIDEWFMRKLHAAENKTGRLRAS